MNEQNNPQPTEPIQNSKNIWIIITSVFITALIVGGGVYAWQKSVFKATEQSLQKKIDILQKQVESSEQEQPASDNSSDQVPESITQISGDKYEVILKENPQDSNKTDVYLKNLDSNAEAFFMTITDVYSKHYHSSEYYNGNLYIIRRIGYDGYPDETWSDELWRYNSQKTGTKLYSSKGIDFRVAPTEKYIAVRDEKLSIIDQNGDILQTYTLPSLGFDSSRDLAIGLSKWSSDGSEFWGDLFFTAYPQVFYKINTDSWSVDKYDISSLGLSGDHDLNGDSGKIAYSNYPALFDVDSSEEYKKSGAKVNLIVYNLKTKQQQQIATSITKSFAPKWIDENTLEYNDPNNENRVQKIVE
jgi:hypothetical protein